MSVLKIFSVINFLNFILLFIINETACISSVTNKTIAEKKFKFYENESAVYDPYNSEHKIKKFVSELFLYRN